MYLALSSVSKDPAITPALVDRIGAALEVQLYRDYAPFWQSAGMPVRTFIHPDAIPRDVEASPIVIFDDPDQAGAFGWHSVDNVGRAFGRAFWHLIRDHGGTLLDGPASLSVTLSHEALEAIGDPYVSWWADVNASTQEALELCDRVQAQSYEIDGVSVSNFLGPRAFRDGDGPYDYMRKLESPWEIAPGGYAIRRNEDGIFFEWAQAAAWVREMKEKSRLYGRKAGKR